MLISTVLRAVQTPLNGFFRKMDTLLHRGTKLRPVRQFLTSFLHCILRHFRHARRRSVSRWNSGSNFWEKTFRFVCTSLLSSITISEFCFDVPAPNHIRFLVSSEQQTEWQNICWRVDFRFEWPSPNEGGFLCILHHWWAFECTFISHNCFSLDVCVHALRKIFFCKIKRKHFWNKARKNKKNIYTHYAMATSIDPHSNS